MIFIFFFIFPKARYGTRGRHGEYGARGRNGSYSKHGRHGRPQNDKTHRRYGRFVRYGCVIS